jgi:VWFA-related protein
VNHIFYVCINKKKEKRKVPDAKHRIFRSIAVPLSILLFLSCSYLFPKDKKTIKEGLPDKPAAFRVSADAVFVNVTVTDKSGNPVTDLTGSDFRVFDDGKPQNIQTFARETIEPFEVQQANPEAMELSHPSLKRPAAEIKDAPTEKRNAPKDPKAVAPRMISIVIDDLTIGNIPDYPWLIEAVKEFIKKDIGPMDHVAILSGSLKVQFPFTNDKQLLLEEVASLKEKLSKDWIQRPCLAITDFAAWQVVHLGKSLDALRDWCAPVPGRDQINESWLIHASFRTNDDSVSRTRNLLRTLRLNVRSLRHFEGTRMVVVFSDGFLAIKDTPEAHQMQEIVNLALQSGIILNAVGIRAIVHSLTAMTISPSAFRDTMEEENAVFGASPGGDLEDKMQQYAPLAQMAEETGGVFVDPVYDRDLNKSLQTLIHHRSDYFVLTYGMPPHKADGAYHTIRLEATRPGLTLAYRRGYYTQKEESVYENRKKEDLMEALGTLGNMNQIPMKLAYNYSQEEGFTYTVSFTTNVNIRNVKFSEEDARRKNQVSIILVAFDENDGYVSGLEKAIDFQLLESSYTDLRRLGLTSRVELKLPAGRYKIKTVVRESNQGKMGSITKSVEIP